MIAVPRAQSQSPSGSSTNITNRTPEPEDPSYDVFEGLDANCLEKLDYFQSVEEHGAQVNDPGLSRRFMEVLDDLKNKKVDTVTSIEKVLTLFKGNKDLLQGFAIFLPRGYRVEVLTDGTPTMEHGTVVVTTPDNKVEYPGGVVEAASDRPDTSLGYPSSSTHTNPEPPTKSDNSKSITPDGDDEHESEGGSALNTLLNNFDSNDPFAFMRLMQEDPATIQELFSAMFQEAIANDPDILAPLIQEQERRRQALANEGTFRRGMRKVVQAWVNGPRRSRPGPLRAGAAPTESRRSWLDRFGFGGRVEFNAFYAPGMGSMDPDFMEAMSEMRTAHPRSRRR